MERTLRLGLVAALALAGALARPASAAGFEWLRDLDDEFDLSQFNYSAIPFAGYDDKTGWQFGGAGFIYKDVEPGINAGLFGVSNLHDFHSATLNYEQRTAGPWFFFFHGLAERAFDYYYGEGDLTGPDDPFRISLYHFEFKPGALYKIRPHLRVGLFNDFRSRVETGVERLGSPMPGDPSRLFPDESTNAMGARAEWDTRDRILNTRKGDYFQLSLSVGPAAWSTLPNSRSFVQFYADLRRFRLLDFRPLGRRLVLAEHFLGGISQGEPGYLFRYRLGGLDALRGYKDNRFRGKQFFLFQEELRWYLNKYISFNGSMDLGDIGDEAFNQLKLTGQLGLRVGLPPGWGQKARVELGFGLDQQTFQIQFGEIF